MATVEFRPARHFKPKSREYLIASKLVEGKTREEVMHELAPLVGNDKRFTYKENKSGRRGRPSTYDSEPKPLEEQFWLFIWAVDKTIKEMQKEGWNNPEPYVERKKWSSKEQVYVRQRRRFAQQLLKLAENPPITPPSTPQPAPEFNNGNEPDAEPDYEPQIEIPDNVYDERGNLITEYALSSDGKELVVTHHEPPPYSRADGIDFYYEIMMRARDFLISRELSGDVLDFISTRAIKDGAKAIAHGVRPEEVIQAVTKTWPDDSIQEFARHTKKWEPKERTIDPKHYKHKHTLPGAHSFLGYVINLAEARIPIFLVGPSGCGKSFLARDLAEALDVEYGELPLTAGATPSWLVGAETISGYKGRPFIEIYENGGVFCFEEIDAADPNMLLLVNNALANESLANPVTGKEVDKSPNFIAVATANTWGLGANRQFTGRERLDAATLDRWRVGRIEMDYDQEVEQLIIEQWKEEAAKLEKPKAAGKIKKAK